jgi:hypothetical protein
MSRKAPAIVRLLLGLFPEDFRRLHERGLLDDYCGPARAGRAARTWYWSQVSVELFAALWGV